MQNESTQIPNPLVNPATQAASMTNSSPLTGVPSDPCPTTAPASLARRKIRRHGRIASLPKIQRDMVNRMLWNGVHYKNIVAALDDDGFNVSERNVSNWATGGYLEWRLEQEAVLHNRLDQDHLLDFLRREDAHELPEIGLQAAATHLSKILLQKLAQADNPEAHIDNYTKLIDLLCRLNREIAATQKTRDDTRSTLGPQHNPALVKIVEQNTAIDTERYFSNPPSGSKLAKPAVPALLPQFPTASLLEQQARKREEEEARSNREHNLEMLQSILAKKLPALPSAPAAKPLPAAATDIKP